MALSEVQTALARLFTDEATRAAFFNDPQSARRTLGLDEDDAAKLAGIALKAIGQFARGLKAKQALDARKMLPLTADTLGDGFADHFRAAMIALGPHAGRVEEARALAAHVARLAKTQPLKPEWIGDLAHYEAVFVEAARRRFVFRLRLFRFPVGAIAASLRAGAPVGELGPRATVGLWIRRPGGRLLHRTWPSARLG